MIHGCVYQQTRFTRLSQLLRKPNGHMTINKPKSSLLSVLVVVVLAEKLEEWGEGDGVEGLWAGPWAGKFGRQT